MTDLLRVLPHFPVGRYAGLLPALERHQVTVAELLTLDAADVCRRTQLPLLDVRRLAAAVLHALHADLGVVGGGGGEEKEKAGDDGDPPPASAPHSTTATPSAPPPPPPTTTTPTISTLDDALDRALGGGVPAGYVTEVTGESGAGKTQLLLTLLLAVQLPPPRGLGRPALYISTEAPLSTRRLAQMLAANPLLRPPSPSPSTSTPTSAVKGKGEKLATGGRPSLDNIISTATPDLESQDHILSFQVPVEVERRGIGLVVLDSVAANYRAEFERGGRQSADMGARGAELVRLGMQLRELARRHGLAVVVANQVADRFVKDTPAGLGLSLSAGPPRNSSNTNNYSYNSRTAAAAPAHADSSPLASRSRARPAAAPLPEAEPTSSMAEMLPPSSAPAPQSQSRRQRPPPPSSAAQTQTQQQAAPAVLLLDHQQRWFTGWGDDPTPLLTNTNNNTTLKTPSLGLVWSTQVSMRIALLKRPSYSTRPVASPPPPPPLRRRLGNRNGEEESDGEGEDYYASRTVTRWRRWMKVVFAPHAPPSGPGLGSGSGSGSNGGGAVEFEVTMGGLRAVDGGDGGGD